MTATLQLQSVLDDLEKRIRNLEESYRQGGEEGTEKAGGKGNSVGIGGDGEPKGEYYPKLGLGLGLGYCTVMRYFFLLCSLGWKFDRNNVCSIMEVRHTCIF